MTENKKILPAWGTIWGWNVFTVYTNTSIPVPVEGRVEGGWVAHSEQVSYHTHQAQQIDRVGGADSVPGGSEREKV